VHYRTRFAPSPSGLLHVGNAYSALYCARWAEQHQAEFILRIEDIDHTRCRDGYVQNIFDDLHWLGLNWQQPVRYQSQCLARYEQALHELREIGVIYPCFCTRKDIRAEISRMASAPHAADMIATYPGTCRNIATDEQQQRMQHQTFAWRLDVKKALRKVGNDVSWQEASGKKHALHIDHDIVIGRKDISFSYHLAVVIDDAAQHISHVIRGIDLQDSSAIHRLLQALLQLPEPVYIHHPLLHASDGSKLSKRDGGATLQSLREIGVEAQKLCSFLGNSRPLSWPFSSSKPHEILDILGK